MFVKAMKSNYKSLLSGAHKGFGKQTVCVPGDMVTSSPGHSPGVRNEDGVRKTRRQAQGTPITTQESRRGQVSQHEDPRDSLSVADSGADKQVGVTGISHGHLGA